jgi:hypothetical protein
MTNWPDCGRNKGLKMFLAEALSDCDIVTKYPEIPSER